MNRIQLVQDEWELCFQELSRGEFLRAVTEGRFTRELYVGFLRETYYNVAFNPRLASLFHAHFDSGRPDLEARFLKHNAAEVGHDRLALADLQALGEDIGAIRAGRPLPVTEAIAAFSAFQIQFRHPLAFLGHLYHLESLACRMAEGSRETLGNLGIPAEAASFMREHADADIGHMQLNRTYIEGFVRDDADLEAVLYGVRGVSRLHGLMFQGVVDEVRGRRGPQAAARSPEAPMRER
jgi:pyrroloquinoline quinone (PQQ) biosynthesis protein C